MKTSRKIILSALILIICFSILPFLADRDAPVQHNDQPGIKKFADYRDDDGNRIFTFSIPPNTSREEIKKHTGSLPHADGQVTFAYYFNNTSLVPKDGVTFARSMADAKRTLYEFSGVDKWVYGYAHYPDETTDIVDCRSTPHFELCRQH